MNVPVTVTQLELALPDMGDSEEAVKQLAEHVRIVEAACFRATNIHCVSPIDNHKPVSD